MAADVVSPARHRDLLSDTSLNVTQTRLILGGDDKVLGSEREKRE